MATFVTAYLVLWSAVFLFVLRLGVRQRRLVRTLESLQQQLGEQDGTSTSVSRAA